MSDSIEQTGEHKQISFSVQMTWKEIYKFTMYHTYHSFAGILGVVLSVMALANLIISFDKLSDQSKTIMTIVAAWFLIFEPLRMLMRSKSQMKLSKAYKKPLDYTLNDEGITVSQDEESQTIEWSRLLKIVETKSQILVYSNRINAFIFPKECFSEQLSEARKMIVECTKDTQVKCKGRIGKADKS